MSAFVLTAKSVIIGNTWSAPATAPGLGAGVTIAGTITGGVNHDISEWLASGAEPGMSSAVVDITNFASGGFVQSIPGLTSGDDIQLPLHASYASGQIWADLVGVFGPLVLSRPGDALRFIDIKATAAPRSSTNPSYVFGVYCKGIQPINGSVGDKAMHALTLQVSGGFGVLTA